MGNSIEWIGKVPNGWSLNRIQNCIQEVKIKNNPIQTTQVLSLVKDKGILLYENKGNQGNKAKEDVSEYKLAYPNTMIVNSMNILIGAVGLGDRMKTILFHRNLDAYKNLVGCLESISKDQDFINKMNGISMVSVPKYQAKTLPEFDVFISHANKDKEDMIEELYQSLNKLGIKIFYDKESLEWGDNWKDRILNGTKKAEFAIIVISQNFFDREWTERELSEFLNRQNRNGQKLILPILHNITVSQLQEKYPSIADIQAIDSSKYSCDQIALLFARQLIKRLKSE